MVLGFASQKTVVATRMAAASRYAIAMRARLCVPAGMEADLLTGVLLPSHACSSGLLLIALSEVLQIFNCQPLT